MKIGKKRNLCSYTMELSHGKVIVNGRGMFEKEDAENFINDFLSIIENNNTSNLILIIDTLSLRVCFPDVRPLIDKMTEIYINSNFKSKYILMPEDYIAAIQIKKSYCNLLDILKVISHIDQAV